MCVACAYSTQYNDYITVGGSVGGSSVSDCVSHKSSYPRATFFSVPFDWTYWVYKWTLTDGVGVGGGGVF